MHRSTCSIPLFVAIVIYASLAVRAQPDFASAFPKIPGCSRTVEPLVQEGLIVNQRAVYRRESGVCGSISIRMAPGIKASRLEWKRFINVRRYKVRGFDAWISHPWCGTPPAPDTIEIYFGNDAVLEVSAFEMAGRDIMTFPKSANYALMLRVLSSIKRSYDKPKSSVIKSREL